jgi:UDP-N-acetylmuramate-alanine ligase
MGTEPPAEKKESQSVKQKDGQTDDRGSRYKGYKGGHKRFTQKKSVNSFHVISDLAHIFY